MHSQVVDTDIQVKFLPNEEKRYETSFGIASVGSCYSVTLIGTGCFPKVQLTTINDLPIAEPPTNIDTPRLTVVSFERLQPGSSQIKRGFTFQLFFLSCSNNS